MKPLCSAKQLFLSIAVMIIAVELVLLVLHFDTLLHLGKKYLWVTPLLLLKSVIKKMLLLNVFGVAKVMVTIVWHLGKLLFIKLLKTIGIRYGTYFSQQKWQRLSQRIRIQTKRIQRYFQRQKQCIFSLNRLQYSVVIIAFLPIILVLFLFGVGFKMTRDVMVKKGSEIGVTNVAIQTAKQSKGFVARLKQLDYWILSRIKRLIEQS